jgi:membrane-associated phospholipid phosphatase
MNEFFSTLPRNVVACFRGRLILWHLAAMGITFILVRSGMDWRYFTATRHPELIEWTFPAAPIGGLVPIMLPLFLFLIGTGFRNPAVTRTGWAIGQAELIGSLISSSYKAVTGRVHPSFSPGPDISHEFRFGFLRGGVFWGWPSSHTTIAFAMAFTVFRLFPKQRWLGYGAIIYALYIGIGVSMNIHWLSDFVAGVIIGTVIGMVVGKSFYPEAKQPMISSNPDGQMIP